MTVSCYYTTELHTDRTNVRIAQLPKPSRLHIEQDSDSTLLNFRRENLRLPFEEQSSLNDARCMHYSRNKTHNIIKADTLCQQYYNDHEEVNHLQVFVPGQLLEVLLQSLQGTASKHPCISEMVQKFRKKYYFSSVASYVRNWVRDYEICIQDKRIKNTQITPEFFPHPRMGSPTRGSHAD